MARVIILLIVVALIAVMIGYVAHHPIEIWDGYDLNAYDYPVTPGMDEWKTLSGHPGMVEVCQIPTSVLRRLSTDGLIETVLNYPLIFDVWAHNTPQQGISAVISQFNGLQELLIRHDSGTKLLAKYTSMDIESIKTDLSDLELVDYYFKIKIVEMVIAQQPIVSSLSTNQLDDLVIQALAKVKQEQQEGVFPVSYDVQITAWLICRALKQANYGPFLEKFNEDNDLQIFVATGFLYNSYDNLFELANRFIANE